MYKRLLSIVLSLGLAASFAHAGNPAGRTTVNNALIDVLTDESVRGSTDIIQRLEKLKSQDPDNDALHYSLALRYYSQNRLTEAVLEAETAVKLDPDNDTYKETLATIYAVAGKSERATEIYLDLLDRKPQKYTNAYTLTALADRQAVTGRDSLALETYDRALLYDPDYAAALVGKAEIYRIRKKYLSFFTCIKPFTSSASIDPEPKTSYISAVLKHIDGRTYQVWHQQLDDMVEDCLIAHPGDSSALKLAAEWFYSTGQKGKGAAMLYRYAELFPDNIDGRYYLLQLKLEKGDLPGATKEAETIAGLAKGTSREVEALSTLGDCYHQGGETNKAYKCYERALKINPGYSPVLNNYAYFLCLEGRSLARAEKMSRITVEKEPDNPTYLDTLGWILHLRKKDGEAKKYFKHAMIYGGKEKREVLLHYAIVLETLGETDVASYYRSLAESKK